MKKVAVDYKGKYFIIQDEDTLDDEYDFVLKYIDVDYIIGDGLKDHIADCVYYGIPPYIGKDGELNRRIKKLEKIT